MGLGRAWGDNSSSQLGDGTTTDQHSPVQTLGISGITARQPPVAYQTPPTISPANIIANTNAPGCAAVVSGSAPTMTDNCPGATIAQTAGPLTGSTFPNGTITTITHTATDAASQSATCSFTLTVTASPHVNDNGTFALDDVNPFVAVLLGTDTTPLHRFRADVNCDGTPDGRDTQPFIDFLTP
jgi:hypothetical protein